VPAVAAQRRLLCDASGGPSTGVVTALDILRSVSGARYTMDDPLRASIGEGEPISAAIHRMVDEKIGSFVVRDAHDRVAGFLTPRDCLRCIARHGQPDHPHGSLLLTPLDRGAGTATRAGPARRRRGGTFPSRR